MRQIKFRVWHPQYKNMLYTKTKEGIAPVHPFALGEDLELSRLGYKSCVLEQFTGLNDCEGTPIYEGDVLSDWTETDEGLVQSFNVVFWFEKGGCWHLDMSHSKNKTYSFPLSKELKNYDYTISGNIHQNPELLNK